MPEVSGPPQAMMVASTATTVTVLVALLIALGIVMIAVAVWLVRSTRSDHPALGPLETMGDRSFRRASAERQTTRLSASRPPGAPDPAPIVPLDDDVEPAPPDEPAEPVAESADEVAKSADEVAEPVDEVAEPVDEHPDAVAQNGESSEPRSASTAHGPTTEQQPDAS